MAAADTYKFPVFGVVGLLALSPNTHGQLLPNLISLMHILALLQTAADKPCCQHTAKTTALYQLPATAAVAACTAAILALCSRSHFGLYCTGKVSILAAITRSSMDRPLIAWVDSTTCQAATVHGQTPHQHTSSAETRVMQQVISCGLKVCCEPSADRHTHGDPVGKDQLLILYKCLHKAY